MKKLSKYFNFFCKKNALANFKVEYGKFKNIIQNILSRAQRQKLADFYFTNRSNLKPFNQRCKVQTKFFLYQTQSKNDGLFSAGNRYFSTSKTKQTFKSGFEAKKIENGKIEKVEMPRFADDFPREQFFLSGKAPKQNEKNFEGEKCKTTFKFLLVS
jgi:hypothetical protein